MSARKYRKKPVVIEAMLFDGTGSGAMPIIGWALKSGGTIRFYCESGEACEQGSHVLQVETLEGTMTALPGDYIIKGVQGEFYPCKPDIFAQTYEAVEPPMTTEPKPYTPTTEEIANAFAQTSVWLPVAGYDKLRAVFNRWLSALLREERAKELEDAASELEPFAGTVLNAESAIEIIRARAESIRNEGNTDDS